MVTGIVTVLVVLLALSLVLMLARDPGPAPGDVAVAYEQAWDRLDFEAIWALSGTELVDGLGRKDFVGAKRAAYRGQTQLAGLAAGVVPERVTTGAGYAVARTRLDLRDGDIVRHDVVLARRAGRWVVVEYRLEPEAPSGP